MPKRYGAATVRISAQLRTVTKTKPHLALVVPESVKRTVTARRPKNADLRTREYLTSKEVDLLMAAAKENRNGHRDATMILIA
jgi:type 1 fimbriae regulatory protein FimB/type 1 fimbriae regulatory protein FimE